MSPLLLFFIFQQFFPTVHMMWGWWQHPTYVNVDPKTYTTPHEHIAKEMLNYRTTMGEELKYVNAQALPPKWKKEFDHLKEVHEKMNEIVPNVNRYLMGHFNYDKVIGMINQMKLVPVSGMTHNEKKVMEMINDLNGFAKKIEEELTAIECRRNISKCKENLSPDPKDKLKVKVEEDEEEEEMDNNRNQSPQNNGQDDGHDGQSSYIDTFMHPANIPYI